MEDILQEGVITGFSGIAGSGLAFVHIDDVPVPVESGHGLRVFEDAFETLGNAAGNRIEFSMKHGIIDSFMPIDEVKV